MPTQLVSPAPCCRALALVLGLALTSLRCSPGALPSVDLDDTVPAPRSSGERPPVLRLAIGAMTAPEMTFTSYIDLAQLLERELAGRVTVVLRRSYREVNALLLRGEVDVAFVCSGAYVKLLAETPVEVIAVPVVDGAPQYRSYIIARQDSGVREFADLRGRRFAFTDPHSNTGRYYPLSRLHELGASAADFFSQVLFTHGHDTSIAAVQEGLVDGAAVDSLVYDHLRARAPERVRELEVVDRSPPFPSPPVVARPGLSVELRLRVQAALLALPSSEDGRAVLHALNIERFTTGQADDYQALRRMMDTVDAVAAAER